MQHRDGLHLKTCARRPAREIVRRCWVPSLRPGAALVPEERPLVLTDSTCEIFPFFLVTIVVVARAQPCASHRFPAGISYVVNTTFPPTSSGE